MTQTILLIGYGKMGGALLTRWQETRAGNCTVIDPQVKRDGVVADLSALPASVTPDVVVFAVKPQELTALLPEYKKRFGAKPLYLSIAAGKTLAFYAAQLGSDAEVVRAMPNTPALIGEGITALAASANVSPQRKKTAEDLMGAVGQTLWVDEAQMDAVTALSGSGPAYVFAFLDSLTKAGIAAGLSPATAKKLAVSTVAGATELARESNDSFEILRQNVTSKGGTTEAALTILAGKDGLEALMGKAVDAAVKRSQDMAKKD